MGKQFLLNISQKGKKEMKGCVYLIALHLLYINYWLFNFLGTHKNKIKVEREREKERCFTITTIAIIITSIIPFPQVSNFFFSAS